MKWVLLAVLIEAAFVRIRLFDDVRHHITQAIGLQIASGSLYIVSCYLTIRSRSPFPPSRLLLVLAAALAFRLTLWPLDPALSEDVFRYRWEGKVQASGGNPYAVRPNDPAWAHLRDETFPRLPGRDFHAVYGPLIESLEHLVYRVTASLEPDPVRQAFWFKLPAAVFDLAAIWALWALLRARGLPPERVLIYAWCPLPVIEFWANGHNDSLVIFFVLLGLLAAARDRWHWAFLALAGAIGSKLWPLFLVPAFFRWSLAPSSNGSCNKSTGVGRSPSIADAHPTTQKQQLPIPVGQASWPVGALIGGTLGSSDWWSRRWLGWTPPVLMVLALAAMAIPYWPGGLAGGLVSMDENFRFLSGFLGGWRNNDSLFGALLWIAGGNLYTAKKIAFALVMVASLTVAFLRWPLERAVLTITVVMLVVSANCHPWYLTWFLPLLAFSPQPWLLLWTAIVPLAHLTAIEWLYLREWHGSTALRWWEYVPVYGMLILSLLLRLRDSQRSDSVRSGPTRSDPVRHEAEAL